MNNPIRQFANLIARIASLMVIGILASGCATGSAVVTGLKRPPISPDSVRLYSSPPQHPYEEIAIISANSYWSWAWNEQAKMDTATREIREKAAKLGANGIILKSLGSEAITGAGMSFGNGLYGGSINNMRIIDGVAIFIPASNTH
jgi:hypothetical protein